MTGRDHAECEGGPSEAANGDTDILLVEDNPGDVRLLREAISIAEIPHRLHVVTDGSEALDFVFRRNGYVDVPRPDMILLDLNLPHTDGHEVLAELKSDAEHCRIPIIVLSSSSGEGDIRRAYAAGANAYLTKPVGPDELVDRLRMIDRFWLSNARLPE